MKLLLQPGLQLLLLPVSIFRGAENRTRTSRSQSVYTTTILRPAFAKATAGKPVITSTFGLPRIELGSHTPEACILPLYYSPFTEVYPSILIKLRLIFSYSRLWFSGRMRPCQGRDGSSILPSRTQIILVTLGMYT